MRSFLFSVLLLVTTSGFASEAPDSKYVDFQTAQKTVKQLIEKHDWLALLEWAEDGHRETQLGLGMSHAQYIAELLALNWENNSINADPNTALDESDLNRIKKVTWRTQEGRGDGRTAVTGTVRLKGFKTLLISTEWVETEEGWRLTGAVG